jgi:hypothetical protein
MLVLLVLSPVRPNAQPPISIGVLSYQPWAARGPDLMARVGITNRGFKTIRYNRVNFDPEAWVLAESAHGWTKKDTGPTTLLPLMHASLESGADTFAIVTLPYGTRRWQIGYTVQTDSLSQTVDSRLTSQWAKRLLHPILRFLADNGGRQEVRSAVFECPQNPQSGAPDAQRLNSKPIPVSEAAAPAAPP